MIAAVALVCSTTGRADTITFDPDGTAPGGNSSSLVATFDFLPGNSLFKGIGSLVGDHPQHSAKNYIQARMGNLVDSNGDAIAISGMNTAFELTVVVKFDALAKTAGTNTTYKLDASAPVPLQTFQIYYDDFSSGAQADDLAGTGFDDGQLILEGNLTRATGIVSKVGSNTLFDKFNGDDYSGLQTIKVSGGASLDVNITMANADFFGTLASRIQVSLYNQSNVTPFNQVNPSQLFLGYSPSRLPINGTGDDFQVQSDPTSSFILTDGGIPEPSSLVLGGLGLVALLGVARRRRKNV